MKLSHACGAVFIAWFAVLGCVQSVTLEVKDGDATCIKAELSASFSITYDITNSTSTVQVPLPASTTVDTDSSSCGSNSLVAVFGPGHALGLTFSTNGVLYSVASLTLQYNLSDSSIFPGSSGSGVVTVVSTSVDIAAQINTTYRCVSPTTFSLGRATVTFSDMKLEAYMPANDLSPTESVCLADQATTAAPTTTTTTTTSTTTSTTASTTTTPAPPPPPPPGIPERGSYSLTHKNGSICLMAQMGLQFNISYFSRSQNKTIQGLRNLAPNLTVSSGFCEANIATLNLTQERTTTLNLTFTLNSTTNKYHLSEIILRANWSDMTAPFSASNNSLDYLRSTLGRSYMCNAEQVLDVLPTLSVNTFRLHVQPFGVYTDQFATAEECQMDRDQMLIPIIVGAALAGLVLIVLIAYLIGRKRSHAGYQTI